MASPPLPPPVAALADTSGASAVLSVRIPRPLLAAVDRQALELNCPRSSLLRALIALGLGQLLEGA